MMGFFEDCRTAISDNPPSKLTPLEREVLYARIRAVSVRVQYVVWNVAATILLYLFNGSLLNGYIQNEQYTQIIIFHSTQIIAMTAYFTTSLTNPGHIKPFESDLSSRANDNGSSDLTDFESGTENEMKKLEIWNQDIIIDPNNAPFNFCWRCKFIRPIRSKHCYDCDRCIGKFDHHCPMVGNCIGGKNHRFFIIFLFFQSIVVLWCFHLTVTDLYTKYHHIIWHHNHPNAYSKNGDDDNIDGMQFLNLGFVFRLLFFLSMFFAMFIVIGLCGFHCYLSSSNQTTYEMVKPHILEKWVKEESKRKKNKKKNKKRQRPKNGDYAAVDISDDTMTEEEDDFSDLDGKYQRSKRNNNMISFDEGIVKNLWRFWTAQMKNEWMTPFKCRLQ